MIIASDIELNIGDILIPHSIRLGRIYYDPQPLLVIRESSKEEYLRNCPEDTDIFLDSYYFYDVESD